MGDVLENTGGGGAMGRTRNEINLGSNQTVQILCLSCPFTTIHLHGRARYLDSDTPQQMLALRLSGSKVTDCTFRGPFGVPGHCSTCSGYSYGISFHDLLRPGRMQLLSLLCLLVFNTGKYMGLDTYLAWWRRQLVINLQL